MPRIEAIVQNQPLRPGELSIGGAMAPGEAIARAGVALTDIGQEMFDKTAELRRNEQAMAKVSQGAVAANQLYLDTLSDPNVPANKLAETVQKGLQAVHDKLAKDIKDPQVRLHFNSAFTGFSDHHILNAQDEQNKRAIAAYGAQLTTSNDALAGQAADGTEEQLPGYLSQIKGNLDGAVAHGVMDPERAQREENSLHLDITSARFVKQIRENPFQAQIKIEADTTLGPLTKQHFLDQADSEQRAWQSQSLAQQEKDDRDRDKAFKQVRDSMVSEMVSRARDGQLTLPDLENQRRNLDLNATEYDLVRNYIEKGPDHASDPRKLLDYTIAVNSSSAGPALQTRLARDYSGGALARDDYWQLQTRLAENLKKAEETDGKIKARHAQAQEMLRADFGVTSPLDQITGASKQAYAMALEELTKRSAAFGGKEDPLQIEPEIRGKYAPIGLFATKQAIDRLRGNLPFKTIQEIGTREQARARGMSDAEYNQLVHRISELDTAEQDLTRIGGK
jgi:hypothetical protein